MISVRGIDDRGKDVRLLLAHPDDLPQGSPASGWMFRIRTLTRLLRHACGSRAIVYGLLMLTLLAADFIALVLAGPLAIFLVLFSPVAAIFLLIAINSFVGFTRVLEDRRDEIKPIWLDHGRCPSCAYPLPDEQASTDCCTVCPECAAAWNRSRVRAGTVVVRRALPGCNQVVA